MLSATTILSTRLMCAHLALLHLIIGKDSGLDKRDWKKISRQLTPLYIPSEFLILSASNIWFNISITRDTVAFVTVMVESSLYLMSNLFTANLTLVHRLQELALSVICLTALCRRITHVVDMWLLHRNVDMNTYTIHRYEYVLRCSDHQLCRCVFGVSVRPVSGSFLYVFFVFS